MPLKWLPSSASWLHLGMYTHTYSFAARLVAVEIPFTYIVSYTSVTSLQLPVECMAKLTNYAKIDTILATYS